MLISRYAVGDVILSFLPSQLDSYITSFINRNSLSEAPQKVSPRAAWKLRTTALECDSASSLNQANRIIKERSPKLTDRKSPRSPSSEVMKLYRLILVES